MPAVFKPPTAHAPSLPAAHGAVEVLRKNGPEPKSEYPEPILALDKNGRVVLQNF